MSSYASISRWSSITCSRSQGALGEVCCWRQLAVRTAPFMTTTRLITFLALAFASALGVWAFLFRSSTYDNTALGLMTTKYRWGKPAFVLLDSNRDGKADAKVVFEYGAPRSPHDPAEEMWESTRCDGYYDLHALYEPAGNLSRVEFDDDRDGSYERILTADEGRAYWLERERPLTCQPLPK